MSTSLFRSSVSVLATLLFLPATASAMTLRQATAASRSTGKPIFAMYGEDYCPACVRLMDRLKSDESLRSYGDAFVVLKIDRDDPDWETFRGRYRVERNAIPQLYFVASDGRELHTQVGAPRGEGLTRLFDTVLADSGPGLPAAQVQTLERMTSPRGSDETFVAEAVRFADAAAIVRASNRHSESLAGVIDRYDGHVASVRGQRTRAVNRLTERAADVDARLDSAVWTSLLSRHDLSTDAADQTLIAAGVDREAAGEITLLAGALIDAASGDRRRSRPALRRLKSAVRTEPAEVTDAVRRYAGELGLDLPSVASATTVEDSWRMWTSVDGGHQTRGRYVQHNDTHVQIETEAGEKIAVRLDQLSDDDRRWVRER